MNKKKDVPLRNKKQNLTYIKLEVMKIDIRMPAFNNMLEMAPKQNRKKKNMKMNIKITLSSKENGKIKIFFIFLYVSVLVVLFFFFIAISITVYPYHTCAHTATMYMWVGGCVCAFR